MEGLLMPVASGNIAYHVLLIVVLGTVGVVEGYDLALGGSLLVLAKKPSRCRAASRSGSCRYWCIFFGLPESPRLCLSRAIAGRRSTPSIG
jgi:hypothetical protein